MTDPPPLRVLLIEDSADDEVLLVRAMTDLGRTLAHRRVDSEPALRAALAEDEAWDLCVSDYVLPGFSGLRAIEVVRELQPGLPLVIVSGTVGEDVAVEAVRSGADDYVMKSNLGRLSYAIDRAMRDASTRRTREQEQVALAQAERRFEGVLDAVPTAIVVVDESGRIVHTNAHVEAVFGYAQAELEGQLVEVLVPADQRHGHEGFRASYLHAPTTRAMGQGREVSAVRKDGTTFRVEVGLAAIRRGEETLVVAAAHDITVRESLESQLQEAQQMEALGRLAGGISHDFNNLLTAINGYADLVAMELPPGSTMREEVGHIRAAGERGAELIRQLLAFGRRSALQPTSLDLEEVLDGLRPLLERLATAAIDLEVSIAPGTPNVVADRSQLEHAIVNLVVNARDAMPDGGVVRIQAAAATGPDGPEATIVVSDTGTGIDDAVRPHLFTPFFTTKAPGKGTGLGLASVHGFVAQSGGRIEVGGAPGHGAVFTIHLPVTTRTAITETPDADAVADRGAGELVLLVEDDDAVRGLATAVLERHGYTVLAIDRPLLVEAALAAQLVTPAVLVTDVIMPGMDGRVLARSLREAYPEIGVVLMSGYAPDAATGHGRGGDPLEGLPGAVFVSKPFDPNGLAAAVQASMQRVPA
jgi:PAS domain S-box-containing protein